MKDFAYDAFISYSHAADGRLAPAVQLALERIARPWYRLRAMRVFRDQTNLSLRPDLWSSIVEHLSRARWFVLLASPEAAASKWVRQEVEWWLRNRSPDRLLIVLTEGEIEWDDAGQDFDWSRTTALPRILAGVFARVPFYGDLRWARSLDALTLDSGRFRDAALDIAATVREIPKEQLDGEAVRTLRRNRLWAASAVAGVLVFLLVALHYLGRSREEQFHAERALAGSQRTLANALSSSAATARAEGDLLGAVRLLSEARNVAVTPVVEAGILATRRPDAVLERALPASLASRALAFAPGAPVLALGLFDGTIVLYQVEEGRELGRHRGARIPVIDLAFTPRGDRLLALHRSPADAAWNFQGDERAESRLVVLDVADPASPAPVGQIGPSAESGDFLSLALDPQSGRLAVGADRAVLLGESHDLATLRRVPLAAVIARPRLPEGASVSLSPGARYLATATIEGRLRVHALETGEDRTFVAAPPRTVSPYTTFRMVFDGDAPRALFGSHDGNTYAWTYTTKEPPRPLPPAHGSGVATVASSPDGRWLASGRWDGVARLAPLRRHTAGTQLPVDLGEAVSGVFSVAFSTDSRFLATTSVVPRGSVAQGPGRWMFGRVHVWRLNEREKASSRVLAMGFDREGSVATFAGERAGDIAAGRCVMALSDSRVACVSSGDGPAVLVRDPSGTISARLALPIHSVVEVLAVAWSPDGARIAISVRGAGRRAPAEARTRVFVADLPGSRVAEIRAEPAVDAGTLAWQPGTSTLAVGDRGGGVSLVSIEDEGTTRFERVLYVERTLLGWRPDGRLLIGASDSQLRSWTFEEGAWRERSTPVGLDFQPTALAMAPTGRLAAIGDSQGRVAFYDLASFERVALEQLDDAPIVDLRIAADGARLVALTRNGLIHCGDYVPQDVSEAERMTHWRLTGGRLVPAGDDGPTAADSKRPGVPARHDEAAAQLWALLARGPGFHTREPTWLDWIFGRRPVTPTSELQAWVDAHGDHPLARVITTFEPP